MSVEDFRMLWRCEQGPAALSDLLVEDLGFLSDGSNREAQHLFHFLDGMHYLEASVGPSTELGSVTVTIRFALCNPPGVDALFLRVVDSLRKLRSHPVESGGNDDSWIVSEIVAERAAWQRTFGSRTAALSCADAIREFVLLEPL